MERKEVAELLTIFSRSYPNTKFDSMKTTLDVWYGFLAPYSKDVARQAAKAYIQNNKFFPTIAEFKKLIDRLQAANVVETRPLIAGKVADKRERGSGCSICPYESFCEERKSFYPCLTGEIL